MRQRQQASSVITVETDKIMVIQPAKVIRKKIFFLFFYEKLRRQNPRIRSRVGQSTYMPMLPARH